MGEFGGAWSSTEPVFVVLFKKDAYLEFLAEVGDAFAFFASERDKQIEEWKADEAALKAQADRAIDRIVASKFQGRFYTYQQSLTRKVKWGFWKRMFSGNLFTEVTETIREKPVYQTALEFAIGSNYEEYAVYRKSLEPDGSQTLWEAVDFLERYDNRSHPTTNLYTSKVEYLKLSMERVQRSIEAEFTISRKAYDAMADIMMVAERGEVPNYLPNYEWLHD